MILRTSTCLNFFVFVYSIQYQYRLRLFYRRSLFSVLLHYVEILTLVSPVSVMSWSMNWPQATSKMVTA
jgi:hypothetical protein